MSFASTGRNPKLHFDTMPGALHVTFDDAHSCKCNFPWTHFNLARVDSHERQSIKFSIGECLVTLDGNNLEPLFEAIETQTLLRVKALPDLDNDTERVNDTYVTAIKFEDAPKTQTGIPGTQGLLGLR